jgi:hypothetical protein
VDRGHQDHVAVAFALHSVPLVFEPLGDVLPVVGTGRLDRVVQGVDLVVVAIDVGVETGKSGHPRVAVVSVGLLLLGGVAGAVSTGAAIAASR